MDTVLGVFFLYGDSVKLDVDSAEGSKRETKQFDIGACCKECYVALFRFCLQGFGEEYQVRRHKFRSSTHATIVVRRTGEHWNGGILTNPVQN